MTTIYIALNKKTGELMTGAKEQAGFTSKGTLARSIGQAYSYSASKQGVKPKDLYEVVEIDLEEAVRHQEEVEMRKLQRQRIYQLGER